MVGGVLCRYWGEDDPPPGVGLIDQACAESATQPSNAEIECLRVDAHRYRYFNAMGYQRRLALARMNGTARAASIDKDNRTEGTTKP